MFATRLLPQYEMPPERCLEIDEPVDLLVAETLMREQQRQRRLQALPDPIAALVLDFNHSKDSAQNKCLQS